MHFMYTHTRAPPPPFNRIINNCDQNSKMANYLKTNDEALDNENACENINNKRQIVKKLAGVLYDVFGHRIPVQTRGDNPVPFFRCSLDSPIDSITSDIHYIELSAAYKLTFHELASHLDVVVESVNADDNIKRILDTWVLFLRRDKQQCASNTQTANHQLVSAFSNVLASMYFRTQCNKGLLEPTAALQHERYLLWATQIIVKNILKTWPEHFPERVLRNLYVFALYCSC